MTNKSTLTKLSFACLLAVAPVALAQTKEPPAPVRTVARDYPDDFAAMAFPAS